PPRPGRRARPRAAARPGGRAPRRPSAPCAGHQPRPGRHRRRLARRPAAERGIKPLSFRARLARPPLALLSAVQLLALRNAPAAWTPGDISVTLRPGESIMLGRQELGAPRAAPRQLVLRRDPDGGWLLRNAEPQQPLVLRRGEERQ